MGTMKRSLLFFELTAGLAFVLAVCSCASPGADPRDAGPDARLDAAPLADGGPSDSGSTDAGEALDAAARDASVSLDADTDGGDGGATCTGRGVSRGMPGSEDLNRMPDGAMRFYYAGTDELSSVRCNAIGDPQTLYYDLYSPSESSDATVLYLHGGGYNVGNANNESIADACRQLTSLGVHCASLEYRRGFTLDPSAVSGTDLSADDAARFRVILEMARRDVLDAWADLDARAAALGTPRQYVVIGESAGGSLASRVALTLTEPRPIVRGVIVGFGTHESTEPVVEDIDFPVVLQGGLLDPIQPAFDNHIWFDPDMPVAKGLFDLADELRGAGVPTRLYVNAQQGHGFGSYQGGDGTIQHYAESLAFFRAFARGEPVEEFTEWRFQNDDCDAGVVAGVTRESGVRYDPRQADLESGLSPAEVNMLRDRPRPCP